MKKVLKTVALCALMGIVAAGCQKEEQVLEPVSLLTDSVEVRTMSCSIGGATEQIVLRGDAEWSNFLNRMLALAEEGYVVTFASADRTGKPMSTKDVQTYVTTDRDAAYGWAEKMALGGYQVTVTYNDKDHTYTCVAVN